MGAYPLVRWHANNVTHNKLWLCLQILSIVPNKIILHVPLLLICKMSCDQEQIWKILSQISVIENWES